MKIAVFNRFWTTHGGGERYSGAFAQALAGDHDVHLLSPTPVDWDRLEEHLGLDLSRTSARMVPADPHLVTAITREYDLFVNCSFMSNEFNGARRGIYVVLFPAQGGGAFPFVKRVGARVLGPVLRRADFDVAWGNGFYPAERSDLGTFRWTSSEAHLAVTLPPGTPSRVRLEFLGYRSHPVPPATVRVEVDGRVCATITVGGDLRPVTVEFDLAGRVIGEPIPVVIRSDVFVPDGDMRQLGVPVASVQLGTGARARLLARFPFLSRSWRSGDFLGSYRDIVSISEFTQFWVRSRWGRESHVIHPPVDFCPHGGTPKEPLILSVGRFFDQRFGHSKKQLELVRAFRTLVTRGLRGWELHLVGGCQQQHAEYLAQVKAEAEGLPVHFHIDTPRKNLNELYRRASIYWHAAGLDESERQHPERLEHFGISTVEAMGAGLVPIVFGKAGQKEIVQHDVNGYHFRSLDDLAARTQVLAGDPVLRGRLAEAARRRAEQFSTSRFAARVRALVEDAASA